MWIAWWAILILVAVLAVAAVIAAVFLDGGLAAVHRLVDPFLEEAYARASSGSLDRDFKTQLQELAHGKLGRRRRDGHGRRRGRGRHARRQCARQPSHAGQSG